MLYTAKCYWPGVTEAAVARIGAEFSRRRAVYAGSLLFPEDELVLCLVEGTSRAAVRRACEQARIPCERVIESLWVAPRVGPKRSRNEGGER
jgi:hypothetical protein